MCKSSLSDEGRGSARLVSPGGGKTAGTLVVTSEAVDAALNENKTVLGIGILAHLLEVLADGDGLLDEVVEILGERRGKSVAAEDAKNLGSGDTVDEGDTVGITKDHTNLRGGQTLLGKTADLVRNLSGGSLEPSGGGPLEGDGRAGNTLSVSRPATNNTAQNNTRTIEQEKRKEKWVDEKWRREKEDQRKMGG